MSRQVHVHKRFSPAEKGQSTAPWRTPILVMGLTALVLVALAGLAVMRTGMNGDLRGLPNREGLAATSEFAGSRGMAAVRAADTAVGEIAAPAISKFASLRGVAAVRAADAAVSAAR